MKHPLLFHYNRLIALALLVNLVVLTCAHDMTLASHAILVNLTLAVLVRQRHVWNLVFSLARKTPRGAPAWIRRPATKAYHLGGLHVGAAIAAVGWFMVFTADLIAHPPPRTAVLALAYAQVALLVVLCGLALPAVRRRWHDLFERSHRFLGWLSLLLFWLQTTVADWPTTGSPWPVLLRTPQLWVLLIVTASVVSPWLTLRKVPVRVTRPSAHAALLRFDYGFTPFNGSSAVLSRSPWTEWHSFAAIDLRHGDGYRVVVSRAGDWTARFIDDPPEAVWVKRLSLRGMASVEVLFDRVVFLATGSGIGPTLTHLVSRDRPMMLVWVTRNPRQSFGDDLVDEILDLVPHALIIDTAISPKPDMVKLAYHAAREFQADGVVCVANKKVTWNVVYGLESRGIPAAGALWDS